MTHMSLICLLGMVVGSAASGGILLKNSAVPGTRMPAIGLGTGCKIGGCVIGHPNRNASFNMSVQWLQLGGRRFDGADSYGIDDGIGYAVKSSGLSRDQVFLTSKTGPGGLPYPLGYNDTLQQAEEIVKNFSTPYVDLLLVHWPTNYGPCKYSGPPKTGSIPTTDPLCDLASSKYSEKECRLSTWRAMLEVLRRGLAKAVGVSNWNTTHLREVEEAGLMLPSVNQVQFSPQHGPHFGGCSPGSSETCEDLIDYCSKHSIVFNSYSPFGGPGQVGKLLDNPEVSAIAKAHNSSTGRVVLAWAWQKGIPVNPETQNPAHMKDDLGFESIKLTSNEMERLDNFKPSSVFAAENNLVV